MDHYGTFGGDASAPEAMQTLLQRGQRAEYRLWLASKGVILGRCLQVELDRQYSGTDSKNGAVLFFQRIQYHSD